MKEARFAMLARSKPEQSERLLSQGQEDINARWAFYEQMAAAKKAAEKGNGNGAETAGKAKEVGA